MLLWEIFFEQCENDLVRGQLHRRLMDEDFEGLRPDLTRGEMLVGEDGYKNTYCSVKKHLLPFLLEHCLRPRSDVLRMLRLGRGMRRRRDNKVTFP